MADLSEKELWVSCVKWCFCNPSPSDQTELLRLARTNFSEAFQVLVHLKIVRLFVESVLRYGLPANYVGLVIKVCNPESNEMIFTLLLARAQDHKAHARRPRQSLCIPCF